MKKGFTLLELVVVIVILGILATLGFTQYGSMVERTRGAEARSILGDIRKLAIAYWLQNGTVIGITDDNLNIGTASDQIPSVCRSSHWFYYYIWSPSTSDRIDMGARRCGASGRSPPGVGVYLNCLLRLITYLSSGQDVWTSGCGY